jgi:hypothetical protein
VERHHGGQKLSDNVTITLSRIDAGQMLDGLRAREKQWDDTVLQWEGALQAEDDTVVCESNNQQEAEKIAAHYAELVKSIEKQLEAA